MASSFVCFVEGHHWRYKKVARLKSKGTAEICFVSTRCCKRCKRFEYKADDWLVENDAGGKSAEEIVASLVLK